MGNSECRLGFLAQETDSDCWWYLKGCHSGCLCHKARGTWDDRWTESRSVECCTPYLATECSACRESYREIEHLAIALAA